MSKTMSLEVESPEEQKACSDNKTAYECEKQTCLNNALGTDGFLPETTLQVSADCSACWGTYLNVSV